MVMTRVVIINIASSSLSFQYDPWHHQIWIGNVSAANRVDKRQQSFHRILIGISNSFRHLWCELKYWSVTKMFSSKPFSCKLECKLVLHTLPWDYSPLFMWIVLAGLRGTRPFIFPNHSAAEEETLRKNLNFDLHDLFGDIIILISFQRNCHRYPLAKKFNSCVPYFRCLTPKPISFSRVEEKKGATEETDWDPCKRVRHHRKSPEKSQTVEQS